MREAEKTRNTRQDCFPRMNTAHFKKLTGPLLGRCIAFPRLGRLEAPLLALCRLGLPPPLLVCHPPSVVLLPAALTEAHILPIEELAPGSKLPSDAIVS